jgi:hypothetical protein
VVGRADTIYTYTGRTIRPLEPDPDDICIDDIAHALSQQCRFTGHTRRFSSVAEHSVRVARMVEDIDPELALEALLHDASEAYLSDIARPVKKAPGFAETYLKYEARLEAAVQRAFRLPLVSELHPTIKAADQYALEAEVAAFCHPSFQDAMGVSPSTDANGEPWRRWSMPSGWYPAVAEEMFLDSFRTYWNAREALKRERL